MIQFLNDLDCRLLKQVYRTDYPLWLNHFVGVFSDYRIWTVSVILIVAFAFKFKNKQYLYALAWIAVCIGLSDLISGQVLKPFFERMRPCLGDCIATLRWACASYFSFPSNHATNAMAMVTVGIFFIPSRRLNCLLFFFALMIGFSRVYFGVHYPGDVLGGFLFGASISGVACLILKFVLRATTSITRRIK